MIIGLTGGIGSGKSLVSEILSKEYGYSVIQTDLVAAELMRKDENLIKKLKDSFGEGIYQKDGTLNKQKYASLIYSDKKKKEISDQIVHPAVWEEVRRRIESLDANDCNIALETALPGKELRRLCDTVWHIYADREVRIDRLMRTRAYPGEYAEAVIRQQPEETEYIKAADRLLRNNGTIEELREEIRILI